MAIKTTMKAVQEVVGDTDGATQATQVRRSKGGGGHCRNSEEQWANSQAPYDAAAASQG